MPLDTGGVTQLHMLVGSDNDDAPGVADTPTLDYGPDIGAAFKALREFQGLSLQDVSDATRIRRAYIQAVEDMRVDELPSRPFALGYVRAYAKLLGLDTEEAVARFKHDAPEADEALRAPVGVRRQGDPRLGAIVAGGVLIVAAIVLWNVAQHAIDTGPPPPGAAATAMVNGAPPPVQASNASGGPITVGSPLPAPPEATVPAPYITPGMQAASAAGGSADAAVKAQRDAAAAAPADVDVSRVGTPFEAHGTVYGDASAGGPVVLQAQRGFDLVVKDAGGKVLFLRHLNAGEAYRPPNTAGLVIDVSDPTAVDVFMGGLLKGKLPGAVTPLSKLGA
ncbi:MAG: cell division protein FtsQ [Caulobacter sp.]|nr:cell division protein FtsQ [Caulobacter sp.]